MIEFHPPKSISPTCPSRMCWRRRSPTSIRSAATGPVLRPYERTGGDGREGIG